MSIIQKSDKYVDAFSETMKTGFTSKDIIDTMRFSDLDGMEEFSNSMAYGNARSWLYTGIAQFQRMVEALKKYKEGDTTEVPKGAEYDPIVVDDILEKWKFYNVGFPPDDDTVREITLTDGTKFRISNYTWILSYGWRYNRNLMWSVHVFLPIHLAVLNGKFGKGSRTFKAMIDLGKNMWQRQPETNIEPSGGRPGSGRSLRHPFGQKKE